MRNVSDIRTETLARYAAALGYEVLDEESEAGVTWARLDDQSSPALLIPRESDRERRGFFETLTMAVERLSWVVGAPLEQVVEALTRAGDFFELRVDHPATHGGRLPLLAAENVMKGFVQILRGGARAEYRGTRPTYLGSDPNTVIEALGEISLLPPAAGSFRLAAVASSIAQLPLSRDLAPLEPGARVVSSTMNALSAVSAATEDELAADDDELLEAVDQGVSTNLLSALLLVGRFGSTAGLRFYAGWDPLLPAPEHRVEQVQLSPVQIDRVPLLLERIRVHDPRTDETIVGWIKSLTADELHPEGRPTGVAVVEYRVEGRDRDVRVELSAEQFGAARAGVSLLSATGTLERISRRWYLTDPREVSVQLP